MELNQLPSDQIDMTNAGKVFHGGPVVELIVSYLAIVDKLRLLRQIEKEDSKRPPASTSPMNGWKDAVEGALNNQRVIRNYKFNGRWISIFEEFNFNRRDETDDNCVIPDEWLASGEKFDRLLVLCPKLEGIHLHGIKSVEQTKTILDVILSRGMNFASFTFDGGLPDSEMEGIVQRLCGKGKTMEYVAMTSLHLNHVKKLIESCPNLKAIHGYGIYLDFVNKYFDVDQYEVLQRHTGNRSIRELCMYLRRWNFHYQQSSSDGVLVKGIAHHYFDTSAELYEEVVSFTELEYLAFSMRPGMDIRRLKPMTNMKWLNLFGWNEDIEYIDELLPHFGKLERLVIYDIANSEAALQDIHINCPHLRCLAGSSESRTADVPGLAAETLRQIRQLPKLEEFHWYTKERVYKWKKQSVKEVASDTSDWN